MVSIRELQHIQKERKNNKWMKLSRSKQKWMKFIYRNLKLHVFVSIRYEFTYSTKARAVLTDVMHFFWALSWWRFVTSRTRAVKMQFHFHISIVYLINIIFSWKKKPTKFVIFVHRLIVYMHFYWVLVFVTIMFTKWVRLMHYSIQFTLFWKTTNKIGKSKQKNLMNRFDFDERNIKN